MPAVGGKKETREAIIEAGARGLAKYGYRKLTMEDVAAEASLSKRTLYLYFGNKKELCYAVMEDMLDRSLRAMDEILEADISGRERLQRVLLARLLHRIENALTYHHTLTETVRVVYPGKIEDFEELAAPDIDRVERAIRAGHQDRSLQPCEPRYMAELLVRGTNSFLPSAVSTRDMREPNVLRAKIEDFIEVVIRGLTP